MTETITSVSRVGGAHQPTSLSCLVLNGLPSPGHTPFHVTLLFADSHSFLHFPSSALPLLITLPGTRSAHCTSPCWLTQCDPDMSLWTQLRRPRTHCDLHLRFHIPTLAAGYTCLLTDLSPTRQPDSGSWGHISLMESKVNVQSHLQPWQSICSLICLLPFQLHNSTCRLIDKVAISSKLQTSLLCPLSF